MRRLWAAVLATALLVTLLPTSVAAQGARGFGEDFGTVLLGMRGLANDLVLPEAVIRYAPPLSGLVVGVVDGTTPAEDASSGMFQDTLSAAVDQLRDLGGTPEVCHVTTPQGATACIDGFLARDLVAILLVEVPGDVTDALLRAQAGATVMASVGELVVPQSVVQVARDPLNTALEVARTAGAERDRTGVGTKGRPLVLSGIPGTGSAFARIMHEGLQQIDRKARKPLVVDLEPGAEPPSITALLTERPATSILMGDGLDLREAPDSVEALPSDLALHAWRCDPALQAHIDRGSVVKSCADTSKEIAGRTGANAIGQMLSGHDVPGFVEVPAFTYRGTITVGTGSVLRGPQLPADRITLTAEERTVGAAALTGRTVGLITSAPQDDREPPDVTAMREALEASLTSVGGTLDICPTRGKAVAARACFARFLEEGVAAILTLRSRTEMRAPVQSAIAAGVPVIGIDEARMGDVGAVYLTEDRSQAGRYQGDQAAGIVAGTWPGQLVQAVIIDATGTRKQMQAWPAIPAPASDAIERSLAVGAPTVQVLERIDWRGKKTRAIVRKLARENPSLRLILGEDAPAALGGLGKKGPPDLAGLALSCDTAVRKRIDSGTRLRACVGPDLQAAGEAAVRVAMKLLAGGTVPSALTLPLTSHPSV